MSDDWKETWEHLFRMAGAWGFFAIIFNIITYFSDGHAVGIGRMIVVIGGWVLLMAGIMYIIELAQKIIQIVKKGIK